MESITMTKADFVSISEAAEYLNVSRNAVWVAIQEGRIAATKIGNQWVIRKGALKKYRVNENMKKIGAMRKKGE
ncbi:MAG: helix-turn-helix domain-containing protein [Planctomycetes bacterium]|nr:helix-turn-helix domain-containing protein [Planctomycetota bacterium]